MSYANNFWESDFEHFFFNWVSIFFKSKSKVGLSWAAKTLFTMSRDGGMLKIKIQLPTNISLTAHKLTSLMELTTVQKLPDSNLTRVQFCMPSYVTLLLLKSETERENQYILKECVSTLLFWSSLLLWILDIRVDLHQISYPVRSVMKTRRD